ncbi:tyrosine-type recombinase/integrase [Flaviflexus sp.]
MWNVPDPWVEPLTGWEQLLRALNRSPETVRTRLAHLRTAARALEVPPSKVTEDQLLRWVASRPWKPETRNSYYSSLRGFFAWYSRKAGCSNPAAILPSVRREVPPPQPAPDDVILEALKHCSFRDGMILRLGAGVGMRSAEIAVCNGKDVFADLMGYSLLIHGKGGRQRFVPIADEMARDILYLASKNPKSWLFPGSINGHLSPRWVSKLGRQLLGKPWTLHKLRHRFATQAYSCERDLIAVQRLLGHAQVSTTQRYVDPPKDAMRRAIESVQISTPIASNSDVASLAGKISIER